MASGYDGSITIDTKVDMTGFNKGTANISAGVSKIGSALGKMGGAIAETVAAGVLLIGAAIIGAIVAIGVALVATSIKILQWGKQMYDTLANSITPFSAFYDKVLQLQTAFNNLRGAFLAVFANLLNAAMPYIMTMVDWLTRMLNLLSMVIAALNGQTTVLLAVETAATKAGNASKGALAAFDKINVLQQSNTQVTFKEVPIDQSVLDKVNKFKEWMKDMWEKIKTWAVEAWNIITVIWSATVLWFMTYVINPLSVMFQVTWDNITKTWGGFSTWFMSEIYPIFQDFLVMMAGVMGGLFTILNGIIEFLTGVFTGNWRLAWQGIKDIFTGIFQGIGAIFKGVVNIIIDLINSMARAIISGMNAVINSINSIKVTIPSWIPIVGGSSWGVAIPTLSVANIPRLATGAVIPPNAAFAAVLGDQTSGRNIEAPESLIRQVVSEELSKGTQNISITFDGNMAELVRLLKPHIDRENVRSGNNLIRRTGQVTIS